MASIQWGATATAKLVFTPISAALGAQGVDNPGSLAILWKPNAGANNTDGAGLMDSTGANYYHSIGKQNAGGNGFWNDDTKGALVLNQTSVADNAWYITAVDWPAGSDQTERWHWMPTATGTWVHQDAGNTNGTVLSGPGTGGYFHIGDQNDWGGAPGMQIALVGVWNVRLGDTNAAALNTNKKTSDWYNNAAGHPIFLCELTSLTSPNPSDLIGGATYDVPANGHTITTNLTVAGDPPDGWTFDGLGSAPTPDPATLRVITSPRLV